jgi:hypothetical protein
MIGKLTKGKSYRSAAEYLMHGSHGESPNRGILLDTNLTGDTPREWAKEIAAYRRLRPSLGKAVFHVSLSPAEADRTLSDEDWQAIARSYLDGMGFEGCPFVAVLHRDTAHPHLHLLAVRIRPDGTVVTDAKDYQRSETLIRQIERDWRLEAVAPSRHNKKKEQSMPNDRIPTNAVSPEARQAILESRLAEASAEAEAMLTGKPRHVAPSLEVPATDTDKRKRDYKRQLLEDAYRQAINDTFLDQIRYIRPSGGSLSIHTKDGGRLQDSGDKVVAYGMSDDMAAERLIEMAMLKGLDSIVLRGSDAFLRRAMAIALQKGLSVCPLDEHQLLIWISVQKGDGDKAPAAQAAAAVIPVPPPAPPAAPAAADPLAKYRPKPLNPLDMLSGPGRFNRRLDERRGDSGNGTPPAPMKPAFPRKP